MEIAILWVAIGGVLVLIGIIGCFLPVLPGPPLTFLGLLTLQLIKPAPFESKFLFIWGAVTAAVTLLDYIIPVYGTKKFGGSKQGVWGSIVGLVAGVFFFPPLGIIIGPLIGAFIGEVINGKDSATAIKAAFGSFVGFLAGTLIKLITCGVLAFYFAKAVLGLF